MNIAMSVLNTENIPLIDGADPYLLSVPKPEVVTPAKAAWWVGQIVALVAVNLFGIGVMLIALHFSVLIGPGANIPELGEIGMNLLPFGVAGAFAGLFYRKWAKQVTKRPNRDAQIRTMAVGGGAALAIAVITWLFSWASIVVIALVVR